MRPVITRGLGSTPDVDTADTATPDGADTRWPRATRGGSTRGDKPKIVSVDRRLSGGARGRYPWLSATVNAVLPYIIPTVC